jgi:hypothetical protein
MTTTLILAPLAVAWIAVMGWTLAPLQHHGTRRTVNGVNRGTQPRVSRPGPWHTAPMPVLPFEPEPETPRRPAETSADPVPLARPYAPEVVYGEVPVQRMLAQEAARLTAVYLP